MTEERMCVMTIFDGRADSQSLAESIDYWIRAGELLESTPRSSGCQGWAISRHSSWN